MSKFVARKSSRKPHLVRRRLTVDRLEDRSLPAGLTLSLSPPSAVESAGAAAATGRVTRVDADLTLPLTVRLTSANPARVTVPTTVVIPAGQASATFQVGVIDDTIRDNSTEVPITAAAAITVPLALDTSFGYPPGSGRMMFSTFGGQTRSITPAPDGKIVVVGNSNNSSLPPAIRVARFTAIGTLDGDFERPVSGGVARGVFDLDLTPYSEQAQAVAVQPDRKILIAGNVPAGSAPPPYNLFITRLNEGGSTDTTFGTNGLVTLATAPGFSNVWDMALQADGKFLVTGSGNTTLMLARFNPNGSLDTTYGSGGYASAPMIDIPSAYSVAVQPDGKAVVAGQTFGGGAQRPGLARFNPDGTLDPTFGTGGVVIDDIPSGREGIYDLTIQPDGKLLAAGYYGPFTPVNGDNWDSFILRYNPDGTRDNGFDTDGLVLMDLGNPDYFSGVGVLPDGRVVASGSSLNVLFSGPTVRMNVIRLLPNGQRDGRATTTLFDFNEGLVVMPNGRIVSAGNNPNGGGVEGFTGFVNATASALFNVIDDDANAAPAGNADAYEVDEDQILSVNAPGVLGNDTDAEGDALTAVLAAGPAHGSLTLNADGSFSYIPNANFHGSDSFTYRPNDGQADGNVTTVSLTVRPVNDPPVAAPDAYATDEDTPLSIGAPGILANDSDADGDALSAVLVAGPTHGGLTLNADGSFSYTPNANYNGADLFTYKPNDGTVDGNTVAVSLTVRPVNDAPVANAGGDVTIDEGGTARLDGTGSSDVDGDALTYEWRLGGTLLGTGAVLDAPFPDSGTYTVTLTVNDGALSATDDVVVTARNVAPTAGITGPMIAVPGQAVVFTFTAADPSPADRAAGFRYVITWGDGQTETVNGAGLTVTRSHTYTRTGAFAVGVTVTDMNGGSGFASQEIEVTAANLQDGHLFVGGTIGNDTISVRPANLTGGLRVAVNGIVVGTFTPTGDVVVYGQSGSDQISLATTRISHTTVRVTRPAYLFGGDGSDTINASETSAGAVLVGGAGADNLTGGASHDLVIGGLGADQARGGDGEDIVIGGGTVYDGDLAALRALMAEWGRPDLAFASRVARLRAGVDGFSLSGLTVFDDATQDQLWGNSGLNWYFTPAGGVTDRLRDDRASDEFTWL